MGAGIAYKISFTLDNTDTNVMLDTIDDVNVGSSSVLTKHPIVNGDIISDHMYKEAITVQISGSFSLNGGTLVDINTSGSTLSNIQKLFERLKNEGIICTLMKVTTDATQNIRFLQRNNMVLTDIGWREKINSMGFNFTFTQVLTNAGAIISQNSVNLTNDEDDYPVEGIGYGTPEGTTIAQTGDDEYIPSIEDQTPDPAYMTPGNGIAEANVSTTSVSLTSINISDLLHMVINKLTSKGYVTKAFMDIIKSYSKETLIQYLKSQVSNTTTVEQNVIYAVLKDNYTFGAKATTTKENAVFDKSFLGLNDVSNTKRFLKYVYETYKTCYQFTNQILVYYTRRTGEQKFEITFHNQGKTMYFVLSRNNINNSYNLTMYEVNGNNYTNRRSVQNLGTYNNYWSILDTAISPFHAFAPWFIYIRYHKDFSDGIEIIHTFYSIGEIQNKIKDKYDQIISNF